VALWAETAKLKRQVAWVQRQLFGRQSERRLREPAPDPLSLTGMLTPPVVPAEQPPPASETVKASQRRVRFAGAEGPEESELRVARSVPVPDLRLPKPEGADLPPDAYAGRGEKGT
jgi:transposase